MYVPLQTRARANPRLGLCCQFVSVPIKFRTTTAKSLLRLEHNERWQKLSQLCLANARTLLAALEYCANSGIGSFRIPSGILPVRTHPEVGYSVDELPESTEIVSTFQQSGRFAAAHSIRTVFHPDQFVVLNSPREEVVNRSLTDLESQAQLAEWVGADVINIHCGGAYGDKPAALARFANSLDRLSDAARSRLTVENDDTSFTPSDLLRLCRETSVPLVYDVHHHRCRPDGLSIEAATTEAVRTWNREPLFHVSSPRAGWDGPLPKRHHDYIDPQDFPECWRRLPVTVEVEAKAKELAVFQLQNDLSKDAAVTVCRGQITGVSRRAV